MTKRDQATLESLHYSPTKWHLPRRWRTRKGMRRFLRSRVVQNAVKRDRLPTALSVYLWGAIESGSFMDRLLFGPGPKYDSLYICRVCYGDVSTYRYCSECHLIGHTEKQFKCSVCHEQLTIFNKAMHRHVPENPSD